MASAFQVANSERSLSGVFFVNAKLAKSSTKLRDGDEVTARGVDVALAPVKEYDWQPQPLDLEILYEDDHLLVVLKPAGLVCHRGAGTTATTLIEGVMYYLGVRETDDHLRSFRCGLVHRLDKDTSGALVVAKTSQAHRHLTEQFAQKTTHRQYITLLNGCLSDQEIHLEHYIHRSLHHRTRYEVSDLDECHLRYPDGVPRGHRRARSSFRRILRFAHRFDLCSVVLSTGRTHQIRVHARSLRAPVIGDDTYALGRSCGIQKFFAEVGKPRSRVLQQMLHGRTLGFTHPCCGEWIEVTAPLPADFSELLKDLRPYAHQPDAISSPPSL